MDANGGTITWYLTANDADFIAAMLRSRAEARRTGRAVDREISKGAKNASLSLDDFRRDLNRSAQVFRDFQIALRGFQMTSLILGVTLAGGAIVELVGALTAATQAAIALPGIIAPVIGAFGTLKTATFGVGDAFKSLLKGDMEKLAEQMAKLSPQAQEFVRSFGRINEAFKPIRSAVQDAFFLDLGKQMESVASVTLPVLQAGMTKVATSMNRLAKEAARVAKEPFFTGTIAATLDTTSTATDTLTKAVEPFAQALTGLIKIGLPYTNMLAEWVVELSQGAAAYINSAEGQKQLTDAINLGISALQKLGDLVGSVFNLFVALFKVSNQEGLSLIDTLIKIVDAMTEWVNSAEGQELLTALFQATNEILFELAKTAGEFLVAILGLVKAYNDLDGPLKDVITQTIIWSALLSPILTYLSSIAASARLVFFVGREAFQGIVVAVKAAEKALIGYKLAQAGLNSAEIASSGIGFWGRLGAVISGVADKAGLAIAALRAGVAGFGTAAGGLTGIINGVGLAIRAAFIATPIGWIVLAVTAVVAAFIWLWNNVEPFREFWINLWNGIVEAAKVAGEWFAGPFVNFFKGIWDGIMSGAKAVGDFFVGVWNGLVAAVTPVIQVLTTIAQIVGGAIMTGFNFLVTVIQTVIAILQPLWDILSLIGAVFVGLGQIIFTIVSSAFQILWTIISTLVQIIGVILIGTLMKLGEFFAWVFNNAVAIITTTFTVIQAVFTTVWGAIVAFFTPIINTIGEIITTVFNAIKTTITNVFNAVAAFITTVWNGIVAFLQPILNVLSAVFTTVFNAIANAVNFYFGLIKKYIIDPITQVVNFVGRTIGQIATFIGNAVTNAYNAVAGFVGRFTDAGKNIIDGIVNGIKNGAGAVVDFVKNVCANALNAVKNFFGIKSPSKVMAKMFGYVMEGAQVGLERGADPVIRAAETTAEGVLNAFTGLETSIGTMKTDFGVNAAMQTESTVALAGTLAPAAVESTSDTAIGRAVVVEQTNNVYTDLDMEQVNRNLTWELGKL